MNYQLLALDLDGTLTNSRKEITPSTRDALIDIQKNGKKCCISQWTSFSGRPSSGRGTSPWRLWKLYSLLQRMVVSQTADPVRSFTANIFQMMLRLRFLKS